MNQKLFKLTKKTIQAYLLLKEVGDRPITYQQIADHVQCIRHYAVKIVKELEREGYIIKHKGYPNHYKVIR